MKLNKIFVKLVVVAAVVGLGASALAQGDFDLYALNKDIQLYAVTTLTAGSNNGAPVDLSGKFVGSAYVDFVCQTNYGNCTIAVQPQTSPDLTNWTALSSYAISTSTSTIYSNTLYSAAASVGTTNLALTGALVATNVDLFPFTVTTPTAVTAGFATQYPLPSPYTNSGTFTPTYGSKTRIGIQNVSDLPRYFRLAITTVSTNVVAASFDGRRGK